MGEAEKSAGEVTPGTGSQQASISINDDQNYSIKEVRVLAGLKTSQALRNLERTGKIPPSEKDAQGMRYWKGSDVMKIINRHKEARHMLDQNKG
jgi:hypothetical protein